MNVSRRIKHNTKYAFSTEAFGKVKMGMVLIQSSILSKSKGENNHESW